MASTSVDIRDLDTLEASSYDGNRAARGRRVWQAVWPPVISVAVLVGIWQLLYAVKVKPHYLLPGPADVASALRASWDSGDLPHAIWGSLHRGLLGFAIALLIGTPLGVAIARLSWLRRGIGPIVSGLQSLPSVAWVPAAIIWFQLSNAAIYTVVLLGAVPSIANGTVAGLDQVPPLHVRVGTVLGARGLRLARYVLMPAALPTYLGGLRQGWAFAWRSLMAAELITQSPALGLGLGQLLNRGQENLDLPTVLGVILVILAVGIVVELGVFAPIERRVLRVRGLRV